jgi:hypothetical protein
MTPQEAAAIISGLFGLAGIASAAFIAYLGYRERKQNAIREAIFREFSRFGGGRQERNIGVSVIGHFWNQLPELEGVFVRLLTNQGVFIVAEGNPDKAHEFSNMERIIKLLESVPKSKIEYASFYKELIDELEGINKKQAFGVRVTSAVVDDWINRLKNRK